MAKKKRRLSKSLLKKAHRLAKKLKGKRGITNPYALATWMIKRGKGKRRKRR